MVLLAPGPCFKDLVWTINWLEIKHWKSGCDSNALVRWFQSPGERTKGSESLQSSNEVAAVPMGKKYKWLCCRDRLMTNPE